MKINNQKYNRSARHVHQRGQAMVEMALVINLLIGLVLGVMVTSDYITDHNIATSSVRTGARLASELGNNQYYNGASTDPTVVDKQIVKQVMVVASTMHNVPNIQEIDIYRPATNSDGSYAPGTDLVDAYYSDGFPKNTPQYTLDKRNQIHPNEAYIGVKIVYQYKSPVVLIPINYVTSEYAVLRFNPLYS